MHKKTQVFVFHFQKQYEFMIFLAEGCIRGSIYDKFTINLQGGYLDQEEIAKIFFLYKKISRRTEKTRRIMRLHVCCLKNILLKFCCTTP